LGKLKKAERDYSTLIQMFNVAEEKMLINNMAQLILLPFQDKRNYIFKYLENLINLVRFYQPC
jgi:hypothetical protein